jgi:hypothetical protein
MGSVMASLALPGQCPGRADSRSPRWPQRWLREARQRNALEFAGARRPAHHSRISLWWVVPGRRAAVAQFQGVAPWLRCGRGRGRSLPPCFPPRRNEHGRRESWSCIAEKSSSPGLAVTAHAPGQGVVVAAHKILHAYFGCSDVRRVGMPQTVAGSFRRRKATGGRYAAAGRSDRLCPMYHSTCTVRCFGR